MRSGSQEVAFWGTEAGCSCGSRGLPPMLRVSCRDRWAHSVVRIEWHDTGQGKLFIMLDGAGSITLVRRGRDGVVAPHAMISQFSQPRLVKDRGP